MNDNSAAVNDSGIEPASSLKWPLMKKVLFVEAVMLPFLVFFIFRLLYIVDHPEAEPYMNRDALLDAYQVCLFYIPVVFCLLATGFLLQKKNIHSPFYLHLINQSWWLFAAWAGYMIGMVTGPFWLVFIVLGAICLSLFGRSIAFAGIFSCFSILIGTTVMERMGIIDYAPFYDSLPRDESGRLSNEWVISSMTWPILACLIFFWSFSELLIRLQKQSDEILRTSEQLTRANDLITRYVAAQVSERILAGNTDDIDKHCRKKLTVFFSDIKGFTTISERLEPEDLSYILNDYLSEMTRIVEHYNGTIDKFVGDAIMVFFGAPESTTDRDHALRAVRMSIDMQNKMEELRERWKKQAIAEVFEIRIGINTGQASIGNFGSEGRMDYTAIGRNVNLAARLESNCAPGKILISRTTKTLIEDEISCKPMGEIMVKGVRDPVETFEVIA